MRWMYWTVVFVGCGMIAACGTKTERPAPREDARSGAAPPLEKSAEAPAEKSAGPLSARSASAPPAKSALPPPAKSALAPPAKSAPAPGIGLRPPTGWSGPDPMAGWGPLPQMGPDPRISLGRTLLTGKRCKSGARLPRIAYDERTGRVGLAGKKLSWMLPRAWGRPRIERRDMVSLSGATPGSIVSVVELFVAPHCDVYETAAIHERVATRTLIDLLTPNEAVAEMRRGSWQVQRGGPAQETSIISSAVVTTPKGPRRISLYTTKVAESGSFSVHAAAACAGPEPGSKFASDCEWAYFSMLKSKAD